MSKERKERILDLKGKKCPLTFIYTKLALEKMEEGGLLKVILDYPPAFKNVPGSVKIQKLGEVVKMEEDGEISYIWIRRKKEKLIL